MIVRLYTYSLVVVGRDLREKSLFCYYPSACLREIMTASDWKIRHPIPANQNG